MNTAELIYQKAKEIPEWEAREVLDFMEHLRTKREQEAAARVAVSDGETPTPPASDESKALCAELQALVQSQPMQAESAGNFIRRMRDEARY